MQHLTLYSWSELQKWLEQYGERQREFAFRGQADSNWHLQKAWIRFPSRFRVCAARGSA